MDSVCPVTELEQKLKEAGEQLSSPPSSTTDLINLLHKTKQLLSGVGQGPSASMQGALVPSMGALIGDDLIKHSDIDVRISVASCLCEVARITAPEIPYKDDIMKKIFKLNVSVFEQLSNVKSKSYDKVIYILDAVAKVKSCLLMLDLECDALIREMFKQFLSKIRMDHPHKVFSDIETIMTMVIEESDEIASELLYLLISHVSKENQLASPASWKLAEKVLRNCEDTLKPYHETITELLDSSIDDYAEVVTLLCQNTNINDHLVTRTTRTNSTHKRDPITSQNGRSTKKQKYTDKNQFMGKQLEASKRGRPKKIQNSQEDIKKSRSQDKRQSSKTKGNIKNSASGSQSKDIPKKWGQDLVGHSIKVWWPLDKTYYKGVVSSYDPLDNKHKVLYVDGDEEVLDLRNEKWKMLDEIPPDQQQGKVTDTSIPSTTPTKQQKQEGEKRNLESSSPTKDNSNSPKSPPPAYSTKATDVICNVDNQKHSLVPTPGVSSELKLTEKRVDDAEKKDEPYPSGELQETSQLQTSETTQRSEKTDDLVCET